MLPLRRLAIALRASRTTRLAKMAVISAESNVHDQSESSVHFHEASSIDTVVDIIGTAIALVIFNQLVKRTNAIFSSSVTYLIPIVAIGWGIFDGESILKSHLIGVAIIFTGIYLVNKK